MAFCMAMKTFPATCRGDGELLFVEWPRLQVKVEEVPTSDSENSEVINLHHHENSIQMLEIALGLLFFSHIRLVVFGM